MRRGTTPTHTFICDVDLTDAAVIFLTYKIRDRVVIEKTKEDLTITEDSVSFQLSQEETLAFQNGSGSVRIQIRARFEDGSAIASNIMTTSIDEILKDGVI